MASGFGRDPILNADVHLNPASSAVTRVARSLNLGDGAPMYSLQGGELEAMSLCYAAVVVASKDSS